MRTTVVRMETQLQEYAMSWCVFWILDQDDDNSMIVVMLIRGVIIMIRGQDARQQNTINVM